MMTVIHGRGISAGVAIAAAHYFKGRSVRVVQTAADDPQAELKRFESACRTAGGQLIALQQKAAGQIGARNASVFEIHRMMLEDQDFQETVSSAIREKKATAEYAVQEAAQTFEKLFSEMDDPYMKGRAADVRDITQRLLRILTGAQSSIPSAGCRYILAADDLTPSETAQLDKKQVAAIVISKGSETSHAAIFARSMGIPAIVGAGDALNARCEGRTVAVDGSSGVVYVDPDPGILHRMQKKRENERQRRLTLEQYRGKPTVTKDGRSIRLCANIGSLADADLALENDAEGIGLFRSEFLYLETEAPPTEEQQFAVYKTVAKKFGRRPVVIRTLDIGADKQVPYLNLPVENNPALGMRAIRLCLARPDIFRTQLRAIYRASVYGDVAIMFPMVNSLQDVRRAKKIAREVREELKEQAVPFRASVPVGIMVETPASAILSDLLAREVDFFSIGTNDLTQYTLAVDRQNPSLGSFCDPHHEALLRLIRFTAENAHKNGIWVGICGELGSDEEMTEAFLAMGIDELSVTPSRILGLRAGICGPGGKT